MEIIGIIPAAGNANRIIPIPCSKEILPVGIHKHNGMLERRPKVACSYLLECMAAAGATKAFFVLRKDKCDVLNYLGPGDAYGLHIAYLTMEASPSVPFTINQAFPFIQNSIVVFGFPDILLRPKDVFIHLLNRLSDTGADIVLGLFKVSNPAKVDVVEFNNQKQVTGIYPKAKDKGLTYTWLIAAWRPKFTSFLNKYVLQENKYSKSELNIALGQKELFVGDVIQAAIDKGMIAQSVSFEKGEYLDIGTPGDLKRVYGLEF